MFRDNPIKKKFQIKEQIAKSFIVPEESITKANNKSKHITIKGKSFILKGCKN